MGTTIFSPAEFTVVRVVSSALILGILVTCPWKVSRAEIASQVKATNRREHPQSFIHDAAKRGELREALFIETVHLRFNITQRREILERLEYDVDDWH